MNDYLLISIRIFIVIIIIGIFIILSNRCIEQFKELEKDEEYNAYNTRLSYRNTNELPWERHEIYSSIPQDITVKYKDAYYYEYGNEEYERKLREIFKNNCNKLIMVVEGTNWSKWINPKKNNKPDILLSYYNNIYNFIYESINNSDILNLPNNDSSHNKIQIVHDILRRYRFNTDDPSYLLFDIDLVLYREGKLQGKHFKFFVMYNNKSINVVALKLIGVVSEDNIIMHPVLANDQNDKLNKDFDIFIPQKNLEKPSYNKLTDYDTIYSNTDKLVNSDIENQLYNKLLADYNPEAVDNYNNNYHPQDEQYNSSISNKEAYEKYLSDLEKNNIYTAAQSDVRDFFLSNLNKPIDESKNSNNIYKNFPYTDDMVIHTNYNDSYSKNDDALCRLKKK